MTAHARLAELLIELFNADELQVFVTKHLGRRALAELPSLDVSLERLAYAVVDLFTRRGGLSTLEGPEGLFAALLVERPLRRPEIEALLASFPRDADAPEPTGTAPGELERPAELAAVLDLLRREPGLVTITGPYGQGKTTLARMVARSWRRGPEDPEPAWVDLQGCADLSALVEAMEFALGVRSAGARDLRQRVENVHERLARRGGGLLVIDAVDDLVRAAEPLLRELSTRVPGLHVLCTSRRAIGCPEERRFRLPGLSPQEGARLFETRARQALGALALSGEEQARVLELSRRLGGWPKGMEIAAAEVSVLPVARLLDGLDDLLEHDLELNGFLRWVWANRTRDEQTLMLRCSNFESGFTLSAAERLLEHSRVDVPRALSALERLSLVTPALVAGAPEERFFTLFEGMRRFARRRSRGQRARAATLQVVLDQGVRLATAVDGPGYEGALNLLELELGNLEAAFEQLLAEDRAGATRALSALAAHRMARGPAHVLIDLAARVEAVPGEPLAPELRIRLALLRCQATQLLGRPHEGESASAIALSLAETSGSGHLRAEALLARSWCLYARGEALEARALAERGLQEAEQAACALSRIRAHTQLGTLLFGAGRDLEAQAHYAGALEQATGLSSPLHRARSLRSLGLVERSLGDRASARARLLEALEIETRAGRTFAVAMVQALLGSLALDDGDLDAAERALVHAADMYRSWGAAYDSGRAELGLCHVAYDRGDHGRALQMYAALAADLDRRGLSWLAALTLTWQAYAELATGQLMQARATLERAHALNQRVANRHVAAGTLGLMGVAAVLSGALEDADASLREMRSAQPTGDADPSLELFEACLLLARGEELRRDGRAAEGEALRAQALATQARVARLPAPRRDIRLALRTVDWVRERASHPHPPGIAGSA